MDLIRFRGLNCYHGCIINAADFFGVDYLPAFAALWSETDFSYDPLFNMYLTKRMPVSLEALGLTLQKLPCTCGKEAEDSFAGLANGAWFTAGMDAFYMPWNEYYQTLNGYHYFLAQKEKDGFLCCFDPTYNQRDIRVKAKDIIPHAFDIVSIDKVDPKHLQTLVTQEAHSVLSMIADFQQKLLFEIRSCTEGNRSNAARLAKYTDAILTNRCLYRHYLHNLPADYEALVRLFSEEFIRQWASVKNGLYKASLVRENGEILEQVCTKLTELFEAESTAAEMVLMTHPITSL